MSVAEPVGCIPVGGQDNVRHLIVLGHPDAHSFNHAIAARYAESARENFHEVELRDLYAMGFDPLLRSNERPDHRPSEPAADVEAELALIETSDVITFVYPLWFGSPPAIVKGYIDRVFGAAFGFDDLKLGGRPGLFTGKMLSLFTSSATSRSWLDEQGLMTSLRQSQGAYLEQLFGFAQGAYFHADQVVDDLSSARAEEILFAVSEKTREVCALAGAAHHRRDRSSD